MKRVKIVVVLLVLLVLSSCSPVQMRPEYDRAFRLATINVNELNMRCQDGDATACQVGLDEAAQILQLIVEAMDGVSERSE